jgi:EAL domain-containing protein (putative c-di-GMP-specific phosphodiesterase class I)
LLARDVGTFRGNLRFAKVQRRVQKMTEASCAGCSKPLDFEFTMAFQPIVDTRDGSVFAHEALVRGKDGGSAWSVLSKITQENRYAFDQQCRVKAIQLAGALGLPGLLSINFMPNAIYEPRNCLQSTLRASRELDFPTDRIIFEFTEDEPIEKKRLLEILAEYKRTGFKTAVDDFGAGYAGLALLADFQPDIVKIDMMLLRGVGTDRVRQVIDRHVVEICRELGCTVIAEGIETEEEMRTMRSFGVDLMQGYLFAKPGFESLPEVHFPASLAAA